MTETATAPSGPSGPLAKILTPSRASGLRTSGTTLASSLLAVIIALGISAVMLFITGKDPVTAFTTITDTATLVFVVAADIARIVNATIMLVPR